MTFKKILVGIVIAIGILLGGYYTIRNTAEQAELIELTLGVESSVLPSAVWVAENKGYFEEMGIDLDITEYDSGKASLSALLEGDKGIDICTVAPTPIMFNSFEREDYVIIATFVYSWTDIKVSANKGNSINSVKDLIGKKIGVPIGTTAQFFVEAFLIKNGVSIFDVEIIDVRPSDLPNSINNNEVDAIVIWEPHGYNARQRLGDDALILPSPDVYQTTFNFVVMKDFAEDNPEALEKFIMAIDKATTYIDNNKVESQNIVAERLNLDQEIMVSCWDDFVFEVSLDQSLIITLEAEARWAIANDLTDASEVPNYLEYFYMDALEKVKPEAVGIIH